MDDVNDILGVCVDVSELVDVILAEAPTEVDAVAEDVDVGVRVEVEVGVTLEVIDGVSDEVSDIVEVGVCVDDVVGV